MTDKGQTEELMKDRWTKQGQKKQQLAHGQIEIEWTGELKKD